MRLVAVLLLVLVLGSPARAQSGRAGDGDGGSQLTARFMGVSTILLSDGETQILFDGFFSRPSLTRAIFTRLESDRERIDRAIARAEIRSLAGVLVAHAHHDHAMDSAVIAGDKQTVLIGSESVANIGRGHGLPGNDIITIVDRSRLRCGEFDIKVIATPHSPHALLWALDGTIDRPLRPPAHALAYQDNVNFSFLVTHRGRRILIYPSAHHAHGLLGRRRIEADIIFLGIGDLGGKDAEFRRLFWDDVVRATRARMIVPIHWDDFFRSLDEPLKPMFGFRRAMADITARADRDRVEVRMPAPFVPFDLGRPTAAPAPISSSRCGATGR